MIFGLTSLVTAINETYDYIIVGGGISSLLVANYLSEDANRTVLVIENCCVDTTSLPVMPYFGFQVNRASMHPITSAPDPNLADRTFPVSVTNVVGDGSIVNGMMFNHGSSADYDACEEPGNPGRGWEGLEPHFKKAATFTLPSESTTKEFRVTYDEEAYWEGPVQVTISSYNNKNIHRILSEKRLLRPHNHAPGPKLLTGTHIKEILFTALNASFTATGVRITKHNTALTTTVHATHEVILAASAIFTPHLLMVSGIGPASATNNNPPKHDLPAVGPNFQDRPIASTTFHVSNLTLPNPSTITTNSNTQPPKPDLSAHAKTDNALAMLSPHTSPPTTMPSPQ
ncbi:FAD/NAD(P)-binding domain-containing protein [Byssothecium circinans]|uniref:FAD/NAD(P)-binding domain-containing protein n=1 Tax=Byssothecium circinans TaxID=147558 RepID=A0A6A5TAS3_9PLEO|nr:FAD/NAD(P)-binding domain-containing protein [Byssothecium circinans]